MSDEIEDQASDLPATTKRSLSAVYGRRLGCLQSLSLLLNAGLMVYAHVGLSAVILSNQQRIEGSAATTTVVDPNATLLLDSSNITTSSSGTSNNSNSSVIFTATGLCTKDDYAIWEAGGMTTRAKDGSFCALEYNENGCILDQTCYAQCFETSFGYSTNCATCFASVPLCSLQEGCFMCQSDGESEECIQCTIPCNDNFQSCSGLTITAAPDAPTSSNDTGTAGGHSEETETESETCTRQTEGVDVEAVEDFFIVYKLEFFPAVETAWNSNAKLLAVLVVLFSGILPYAKNVILMLAWYLPLTMQQRSAIFTGLKAIGKYTLVDVYIVILIMIGLILELTITGDIPLIIKSEPRGAIIAFLVATIWEFLHLEWMVYYHDKYSLKNGERGIEQGGSPPFGRTGMWLLLITVIVLFVVGSTLEVLRFTTILAGETNGCPKGYSLYTLGAALVSDFFLYQNDAKAGVWALCFGFFLSVVVMPVVVHLVLLLALKLKSASLCKFADSCWTFASIEVLLLGIVIVQYKFSDLVEALAGNEGAQFFGIVAELGPAFWVLLASSVLGCFTNHIFNRAALFENVEASEEAEQLQVTNSKNEEPTEHHTELYEDPVVTIETGITSEG